VGNGRTALLAWLFARSAGARFLVRMEDLDAGRVRPGIAGRQLADLAALGLESDEPVQRQSERMDLYSAALEQLDSDGRLYECFCTRAEIREAVSAPHGAPSDGLYPGTCSELTALARARRSAAGRRPALRVRAEAREIRFEDRVMGARLAVVDDFVVRRNDGAPAYNLAVIVDDAAQGIGEVVRGADLADTTPRQLLLGDLLGLKAPGFAHVPLVLGPDGTRLAKRHGGVTLNELAPGRALGWMAQSLGLARAGEPGLTAQKLLDHFDPASLPVAPVTYMPAEGVTPR